MLDHAINKLKVLATGLEGLEMPECASSLYDVIAQLEREQERRRHVIVSRTWPASDSLLARRIVLTEWQPGTEWVTHLQCSHAPGQWTSSRGHYFHSLEAALADYHKRAEELR